MSPHPAPSISTEAILAAGIVAAAGRPLTDLDDAALSDALRQLPVSTKWERMGVTRPQGLAVADSHGLSSWVDPGTVSTEDEPRLLAAWRNAVGEADNSVSQYLRLQVDSTRSAERLQALGTVGGRRIVAIVRGRANDFRWHWPLRVGIVPGPAADDWLAELRKSWLSQRLYEVELIPPDPSDQHFDVVLVDSRDLPDQFRWGSTLHFAGAVIAVGAVSAHDTLDRLISSFQPNVAIAIPADDVTWWETFVNELAHDCPIDAAAVAAHAGTLVAGDPAVLDLTAVGHWAVAADAQSGSNLLSEGIEHTQFRHEYQGACQISDRSRSAAGSGPPPELRRDYTARAAKPPRRPTRRHTAPRAHPSPTADLASDGNADERRLVAVCWFANQMCRKVLPPVSPGLLELKIALPPEGAIAADKTFPTPPETGPSVTLDIRVESGLWSTAQHQQISLPLSRVDQPSTSAVFEFTTGESGTVAEFDIVVSHHNRPLQAAMLSAAVRSTRLPSERITLVTYPLSTPARPIPNAPMIDVALDGRGPELRNASTGASVPLTAIDDLLDSIELHASTSLGRDDAPDDLEDQRSVDLLIQLARMGSELHTQLRGLGLDQATSIDVLVMPTTRIFPLELVYEGPAPLPGAIRCAHHRDRAPPIGEACRHASPRQVCPYSFWGAHRRISRTVQMESDTRPVTARQVVIDDVLWGAAKQADHGAPPGRLPTQAIRDAALQWFNAAQHDPVTSWREWRKQVATRHPGLLVLLAHTELSQREPALLIGTQSLLARPDVSSKVVRCPDDAAPIVVLMACASGSQGDAFGSLPGTFTAHGAGAVVATLTKIAGRHGAIASAEVMRALSSAGAQGRSVGDALLEVRRALIAQGVLLGLLLVGHGNTEIEVMH